MYRDRENSKSSFVFGALIGALLALFFAPFSGRKMREKTMQKGKETIDKAKNRYTQFEDETIQPTADRTWERGQEMVDQAKDGVRDVTERVRSRMKRSTDDMADSVEEAVDRVDDVEDKIK